MGKIKIGGKIKGDIVTIGIPSHEADLISEILEDETVKGWCHRVFLECALTDVRIINDPIPANGSVPTAEMQQKIKYWYENTLRKRTNETND